MKNSLLLFSIFFILCFKQTEAQPNLPDSSHVLVVYKTPVNQNDTLGLISEAIKDYYQLRRGIPASNIVPLDGLVDTWITDSVTQVSHRIKLEQQGESIVDSNNVNSACATKHAWIYFNENIAIPIADYLNTTYVNGTKLKDVIRYIVICKGVPFKIYARWENYPYGSNKNVVIDPLLCLVGETIDDPDALLEYYILGCDNIQGNPINNPYYKADLDFTMDEIFIPNHYSKTINFNNESREISLSYLVSHLSAPLYEDITSMIDKSIDAISPQEYDWFIDAHPTPFLGYNYLIKQVDGTKRAFDLLGIDNYFFDKTPENITDHPKPIMTYTSHGVHQYWPENYITEILINFDLADGSIFNTAESFNGYTIGTDPIIRSPENRHGVVAEYIHIGGTSGMGHAFEPTTSNIVEDSIMFPSYALGYTFIESVYQGMPNLRGDNVVVGDPLTRITYPCEPTIIATNTVLSSGDYECDIIVEENATLTIDAGSTINFIRNANVKVYGTLEIDEGAVLNFYSYCSLELDGNLAMIGNSAFVNFNDKTFFKANSISVDNSLTITYNNDSEFYINEEGTFITYSDNSFIFNNNSNIIVDGNIIVNEGNSLIFNDNSNIIVNERVLFNEEAEITFNDNSYIKVYGTFISKGQSEINNVVFNLSGTSSHQLSISNPDTVLVDFTTFNHNGLELAVDQAETVKHISISNSFFESASDPLYIACKNVVIEEPVTISNCSLNNCSGTGMRIIQVPEITIENCTINLVSALLPPKGIILKNNGSVDIINCNITGSGVGIESMITSEDDLEINEELETDIFISQCIFENLTTGILIDYQVASYNSVHIFANHFDNCKYSISIDDFLGYNPTISENIIYGSADGYAECGISLTNGDEVFVMNNSITNYLMGLNLNNVTNPYVKENVISAIDLTEETLSGILSVSSGGQIRKNTIRYHKNGIELGSSSPFIGANTITDNNKHGIYISDNSNPDLSEAFVGEEQYPLSGYNTIRENGLCDLIGYSELYLVKSAISLEKGCNTIADDREEQLNCGFFYLIDGEHVENEIQAQKNYWGEINEYNPEERFGENIEIDFEGWLSSPCTYGASGNELILSDSKGTVYDTIYSTGITATGLTDLETRYATANNYYYSNQFTQANQEYLGIIQDYGNIRESLQAYNRIYTIANITNSNPAEFNQLKNFYLQRANNQSDSVMIGTLNHLSDLCLVSAEEYITAINKFDVIAQQNPNTDVALYRQIDALTTSLLIGQDSTMNKGNLVKYRVNDITEYNNKLSELLKTRGKSGLETGEEILPLEFTLYQNYPNPFNPATTIKYDLPNASDVSLLIYDILGRKVNELVNTKQQAGRYEIQFNASNLASGIYIYQLVADKFISSKKMILLK